jgi:hypothetical protein
MVMVVPQVNPWGKLPALEDGALKVVGAEAQQHLGHLSVLVTSPCS